MEKYDVNRDKFLDMMAKHHLDEGVNVVGLWEKAQQGEDIKPPRVRIARLMNSVLLP